MKYIWLNNRFYTTAVLVFFTQAHIWGNKALWTWWSKRRLGERWLLEGIMKMKEQMYNKRGAKQTNKSGIPLTILTLKDIISQQTLIKNILSFKVYMHDLAKNFLYVGNKPLIFYVAIPSSSHSCFAV